jgi:hemoglobin
LKDIATQEDLFDIITNFYKKAGEDELLGTIFKSKIPLKVWDEHMQTITLFWCGILFQTGNYAGRPFPKHLGLGLKSEHFQRWLFLLNETIDTYHIGEKADHMKTVANNMATMFLSKLNHIENNSSMISIL